MPQETFLLPGEIIKQAPKIHPNNCIVNWDENLININNFIRGLAPYPGAKSFFVNHSQSLSFKIFESFAEIINHNNSSGEIISDGKYFFKIACKNGFLHILNLQLEGKNRMNTLEFLRGFKLSDCKITSTLVV